ncbi:hypothetical protein C5167_010511 [Papaver somniferum]|uniref:DNL-type domain-containing protein n=1 Tax=Papaver somniferum TaxID=3469 RepID=A0A4Y7K395_PAPSO|nr:uncharacterized protein LOC113289034 [Papaver somniferum]RZC66810.1 hypothetical protein C5167_010511 [Papaver somniferum]
METLSASATVVSSSSSTLSIFSPKKTNFSTRFVRFPVASKGNGNESDHQSDSTGTNNTPLFNDRLSFSPLSKDAAMGLVLSAANCRGWKTGSGMEGPPVPVDTDSGRISTFPWSLFTKSPRRRMRVAFTCNICGQRTTRAINPHAYTDGTVFVQCCGCNVFHKLVDNLNLFHEMKCYVSSSFNPNGGMNFKYLDMDGGDDADGADDDFFSGL